MKRNKTAYVRRGYLVGEGATKTEAKANLEKQVDWACSVPSPTIEMRFGLVILIATTANGWETKVFDPSDMVHGKQIHCSTCHGQNGVYTDALESARIHAAQWMWNHGTSDAEHVALAGLTDSKARELKRWIEFQRKHAAALLAGHTPADAFNIANGLQV